MTDWSNKLYLLQSQCHVTCQIKFGWSTMSIVPWKSKKVAVPTLKFEHHGSFCYHRAMHPKDADGMVNGVDLDKTAPKGCGSIHCLPKSDSEFYCSVRINAFHKRWMRVSGCRKITLANWMFLKTVLVATVIIAANKAAPFCGSANYYNIKWRAQHLFFI